MEQDKTVGLERRKHTRRTVEAQSKELVGRTKGFHSFNVYIARAVIKLFKRWNTEGGQCVVTKKEEFIFKYIELDVSLQHKGVIKRIMEIWHCSSECRFGSNLQIDDCQIYRTG